MGAKSQLDQFFTTREASRSCVEHLFGLMRDNAIAPERYRFVEPSAGDGSFVDALVSNSIDRDSVFALDIAPQRNDIQAIDWFDVHSEERDIISGTDCPIVVIGNPPFGQRSTLAKRFIEHAKTLSPDIIAFVLPNTFLRLTNQKCFKGYRLVNVMELPSECFLLDGERYHVPCSFFVLTNLDGFMSGIELCDFKVKQPIEYSFLGRGDTSADFTVNGNSGAVKNVTDVTNSKAEHYIKVNSGYDVDGIRSVFEQMTYQQLSSCNGGNWWINRNDINKAFLAYRQSNRFNGE